jgi:hypothetical protein
MYTKKCDKGIEYRRVTLGSKHSEKIINKKIDHTNGKQTERK